jgi:hypothetical protein
MALGIPNVGVDDLLLELRELKRLPIAPEFDQICTIYRHIYDMVPRLNDYKRDYVL